MLLVIGTNVSADTGVHSVWAAAVIGVSSYMFLTFLMIVPRLDAACVYINNVLPRVNGYRRDRRGR